MTRARSAALLCALAVLTACGGPTSDTALTRRLTLWTHGGTPAEQAALRTQVAGFEKAHAGTTVAITVIQEGDYGDTVQQAVAAGELPDVLDVDGPLIASYAYQGALAPLDDLIGDEVRNRMLPSLVAQGTWRGQLWAVGAFDSGLALYGDRRQLARAGVRVPSGPDDAWTAQEMAQGLSALAAHDADGKVLDLKLGYGTGEWLTYGFAPLISSAGAALIHPESGKATGILDSPAAVRALTTLGSWVPRTDPDKDGKAFTSRRVALSWVGHWTYGDYAAALGRDLVVLPLPDLGEGSKSGQGSWAWSVGADTSHGKDAATLVSWLTDDAAATSMTGANGAVPGTKTSLAASALVGPGKPLQLYADQLARTCGGGPLTATCVTVPRPVTPAYPAITAAFSAAVASVLQGGDPQLALAKAARAIDADLVANDGYTRGPRSP